MPVSYRIHAERRLVVTRWSGAVTLEEAKSHFAALASDPAFDPTMDHLSYAEAVEEDVSFGELRVLARESPFTGTGRSAIVASENRIFGVSRQYVALTRISDRAVRVFRELNEALDWLGIPDFDVSELTGPG